MRTDLAVDPRVVRVASMTKAPKVMIIGCLHWLWSMGQTQSTDGFIPLMTYEAIDGEVGVPGFANAMSSIGWLFARDNGVEIPDFDSYFGKSSKTRAKDRLRKSRDRVPKPKPEQTRTQSGHNLEKIPDAAESCEQRIGSDLNGTERNGTELTVSKPVPGIVRATGSANRFIADRQIRTGNVPPGFVEFMAAYPTGKVRDQDGLLALWTDRGLEDHTEEILAGLAGWKDCEEWQTGFGSTAKNFLFTRQWRDTPPPPKPKPLAEANGFSTAEGAVAREKARLEAKRRHA